MQLYITDYYKIMFYDYFCLSVDSSRIDNSWVSTS